MPALHKPKEIIKEGLSEYFIYTIEGTETIPNGWSKRMRSFEGQTVPFKVQYRYRPVEYGDRLVRMYLLANDKESKLGTTPLPDGMVRVFRQNGRDGLSFLVAQQIKYVPIGDKIELNLGPDPEVLFELVKLRTGGTTFGCRSRGPTCSDGWTSPACRSRSTAPSSAGTIIRFSPSESATTRRSPSTWRSVARCRVTSSSAVRSKQELQLPDGRVSRHSEVDGEGELALRGASASGQKRQAEQRHRGRGSGQAMRKRTMDRYVFRRLALVGLVVATVIAGSGRLEAENVDLSTVPSRDSVQLTIYNSEDLTLVRETRKVSFKKGVNPLQFSWANTLIDPTSVRLRFLTHSEKLELLDTTFPHSKPQMLYWNVQSEIEGEATVEITYFTSGISWSADYLCIANPDETEMGFEGFVRVAKDSGEE